MKIIENRIYFVYALLGSFYFISKAIYYILDIVCLMGLLLGLIAAVITILIGLASFKEYNRKTSKPIAHWLAFIVPLIIIVYTPLHMTIHMGIPVFQFQIGKLTILIIFEVLAILQFALSFLMYRGLRLKK